MDLFDDLASSMHGRSDAWFKLLVSDPRYLAWAVKCQDIITHFKVTNAAQRAISHDRPLITFAAQNVYF